MSSLPDGDSFTIIYSTSPSSAKHVSPVAGHPASGDGETGFLSSVLHTQVQRRASKEAKKAKDEDDDDETQGGLFERYSFMSQGE